MDAIAGRSCPPARNALGTAKQPTDQHQDRRLTRAISKP